MSTLTDLKHERELQIARTEATARPTIRMLWTIDPLSGRAVGVWTARQGAQIVAGSPEPVFT